VRTGRPFPNGSLLLCCWFLAALAAPQVGWAQNPRITLELKNATLETVCRELSRVSGVPILEFGASTARRAGDVGIPVERAPRPEEAPFPRMTFAWKNVTLAAALREVAAKYDATCYRRRFGYQFSKNWRAGAPPAAPAPLAEWTQGGTRLQVVGVQLERTEAWPLGPQPADANRTSRLSLQLSGLLEDGAGDMVAQLRNVWATDDLGNVLGPVSSPGQGRGGSGERRYPDEFAASIRLPAPPEAARRLTWVEGELWCYRRSYPQEATLPFPPSGQPVLRRFDHGVTLALLRVGSDASEFSADPPDLRAIPEPGSRERVEVELHRRIDPNSAVAPLDHTDGIVLLNGKGEPASSTGGGGGGGYRLVFNGWQTHYHFRHWSTLKEKPESVRISWIVEEEPYRLLRFRFQNVPLPQPPQPTPQARPGGARAIPWPEFPEPRPTPLAAVLEPEHPFHDARGGELVGQASSAALREKGGSLLLGLSRREARGWGPVRWLEVPVDAAGRGRLRLIRPGRYQVYQRYLGLGQAARSRAGSLGGGEVVEIVGGKTTALKQFAPILPGPGK